MSAACRALVIRRQAIAAGSRTFRWGHYLRWRGRLDGRRHRVCLLAGERRAGDWRSRDGIPVGRAIRRVGGDGLALNRRSGLRNLDAVLGNGHSLILLQGSPRFRLRAILSFYLVRGRVVLLHLC